MGGIAQLGLRESLSASGSDIITEEVDTTRVIERTATARPDAVLLDLDATGTPGLAADLLSLFPSVTVVACSMVEPRMRVFPPGHRDEPYDAPLTPPALAAALTSTA